MKYAWIENGRIRDLASNPTKQFHPEIAIFYDTEVGDEAKNGWDWDGTNATAPVVPDPVLVPNPVVRITSPVSFTAGTTVTFDLRVVNLNDDTTHIDVNGTYFVPIKNSMTGDLNQIIEITVVNGVASTDITISTTGIYEIAGEFIRPKPVIPFESITDIVVV